MSEEIVKKSEKGLPDGKEDWISSVFHLFWKINVVSVYTKCLHRLPGNIERESFACFDLEERQHLLAGDAAVVKNPGYPDKTIGG